MRKKVRLVIILAIIIFIGIIGSSRLTQPNENGNLANLGLACEENGTIYYNKYEKGIYAKEKGKETKLTDETAYSIQVIRDKIYYITVADFNSIMIKSVDIDGQNRKNIATIYTSISKIYVENEWIYYATNETGKGIARVNLQGQNEEIMVPENVQDFQVADGIIYYVNTENKICQISTSGENSTILNDTVLARKIQVVDSWIYYYNAKENALFRLKSNGKKNELVSVLIKNEIYNISGKYVYYFDEENAKIAKMQIGKSNRCKDLVDLSISKTKINIAADELYYLDKSLDNSQNYQIYRVKINGDKAQSIEYNEQ